tara:strand:+ start:459 stop:647 length:189 start_codon:yes stop_codon:yes gene_type:complete
MKLDFIEGIEIHEHFLAIENFHSIPLLLEGIFMRYNMIRDIQVNYINMDGISGKDTIAKRHA